MTAGRPRKEINWQLFEDLAAIQCTQGEIANVMHINVDTLHDRAEDHYGLKYSEVYKRYADVGKTSLRRMQMKLAQKSAAMAIFLGKQYLGQKDNESMIQIPPEMMDNYTKLMNQLSQSQWAQKSVEVQAVAKVA